MIFPKTQDSLFSKRELWNDGYLVFGCGEVVPPGRSIEAVLRFFGLLHVATSISGFPHELRITERTLHRVDLHRAHQTLVSLLSEELRMFSSCSFETKYIEDVAAQFFQEMGECEVYTNMSTTLVGSDSCRSSSWSPVTRSSRDFLLCAINDRYLGYWLYTDDE